jgi:hypothetical protein
MSQKSDFSHSQSRNESSYWVCRLPGIPDPKWQAGASDGLSAKSLRCGAVSPNKSLQRAALGIKCSAAGERCRRSGERRCARVLTSQPAVAELNR